MAQQIVIDIVAETKKLTQGLDETNKQVSGLDKNVKAAAKSAVALASAFVLKQGISFLKDGIDEAKDAAAAMRAATATFGEGSAALKKITDDADKFGKELAVDNDELIKLATQLGSRLPKEIQASSVELVKIFKDVEAFTGGAVSAEAAGNKLAKAFADGELKASELQKIFPGLNASIYEQAEALSKAGKNQEAVNLLTEEGAKKYGDAAAKNVDATQKFNVALDNFKETLGTKVLPILEKGIDFLTRILDAFDKLPEPVQNFSLGLLALVAVGGPLLSFIANIQSALVTLGLMPAATGAAATGVNLFSLALRAIPIVAIISTIALLIANWDDVSKKAKELWEAINKWWDKIYEDIKDFAGKAIDWLKENWPKILAVLTGPFGLFILFLVTHKEEIVAKLKEAWEKVKEVVTIVVTAYKDAVVNIFETLKTNITEKLASIAAIAEIIWTTIKEKAIEIVAALLTGLGELWDSIASLVVNIVTGMKNSIVAVWNKLKDVTTTVFTGIKEKASEIWTNIKDYIVGVVTNVVNKFNTVKGEMIEVGKDIANGIIEGLFKVQGVFRTKLASWIKDNIPDWIKKVLDISSPSKVMAGIGTNIAQGLNMGLNTVKPGTIPSLQTTSAPKATVNNITINAGAGTDAYALGRTVSSAVKKYGRVSAKPGTYTAL